MTVCSHSFPLYTGERRKGDPETLPLHAYKYNSTFGEDEHNKGLLVGKGKRQGWKKHVLPGAGHCCLQLLHPPEPTACPRA